MDTRRAPHWGSLCGIELVAERGCVESDEISRSDETKCLVSGHSRGDSENAFALDEVVGRLLHRAPWLWGSPHGLGFGMMLRVVRWTHAALRSDETKCLVSGHSGGDSENAFALDEVVGRLLHRAPWLWGGPHGLGLGMLLRVVRWTHAALR